MVEIMHIGAWKAQTGERRAAHTGIGIEIPGGQAQAAGLAANLDPQHGGGIWGFVFGPRGLSVGPSDFFGLAPLCAATAALAVRLAARRLGDSRTLSEGMPGEIVYVHERPDTDTIAAIAVLETAELDRIDRAVLDRLERLDNPRGVRGTWAPRPLADPPVLTVGDDPGWRGVQALAMGSTGHPAPGVPRVSIARAVEIAAWLLLGRQGPEPEEHAAAVAAATAAQEANRAHAAERLRVDPSGTVAHGVIERPGWFGSAYALAPVGFATSETYGIRGADGVVRPGRKHTIGVHPDADEELIAAVDLVLGEFREREPGWGGNLDTGIVGSPQDRPSVLAHEQVLGWLLAAIDETTR